MKSILLLLFVAGLAINVHAQTPTPTPNPYSPFNPFASNPTPTPISRTALATVPSLPRQKNSVPPPSTSAEIKRNSSVALTSPTPRPNSSGIMFGNGAMVTAKGNNLVVVSNDGRIVLPRRASGGPPSYPPGVPSDCRSMKRWLDTHKVSTRWRITLEIWFEACGF